ncbi:DUF416 family protein [Sorangium sp. So ce1667]
METFDEERLEMSLQNLEPWKRIAFMAQIGERMLANYQRFSAETGFGDVSVLRNVLDTAWTWIESGRLLGNLAELREDCERQAPDTEQFRSPYTSAALDTANVPAVILDALERPDEGRPVDVASLARDTVDLFIQERMNLDPNAPGFEETILRHNLMQSELHRQREDLEALEKWSGDRETAGRELRAKFAGRTLGSLDG